MNGLNVFEMRKHAYGYRLFDAVTVLEFSFKLFRNEPIRTVLIEIRERSDAAVRGEHVHTANSIR